MSLVRRTVLLLVAAALTACASTLREEANALLLAGRYPEALTMLERAAREAPDDRSVQAAVTRARERALNNWLMQAAAARTAGRLDAAAAHVAQAEHIDAAHPRVRDLRAELARDERHAALLVQASAAIETQRLDAADAKVREVLAEAPGHPAALAMQRRIGERRPTAPPPASLGSAFQKPVTLEFREAPLRSVFEALARGAGVNFVFDKDVRGDARITIMLRQVSIDEAMRVILATQQLERKLLNDSTVLIFPNNQAKQREHQDLVTRSFYLTNADVKQAQNLIRTIAKTRDIFVDERLNLVVVRDTPAVVRLVESLVASLDLPEPEVILDVEVLEIASNRLDEIGIQWPERVFYGAPGNASVAEWGSRDSFRASIANPAVIATLRGTSGTANIIANPRLRARNREKARVHVGEKLPVFTTTSTANVGVSASVTYLDVGLKLDVEPTVQLDNQVVMKVGLEVSNLVGRVEGPQGSVAYQIGTRVASTSLRLRDGETQVLAGLINDEDRRSVNGIPGLAELPVVGRLFGLHSDTRNKSEVVLLITPHIVRNVPIPDLSVTSVRAGVDANPGALGVQLRSTAQMALPAGAGRAGGPAPRSPAERTAAARAEAQAGIATLFISTSGEVKPGETVAVTLQNRSPVVLRGELGYDTALLQSAQGGAGDAGRLPFDLSPRGEQVFLLRALPNVQPQTTLLLVTGLDAAGGEVESTRVEGSPQLVIGAP